MKFKQIIYYLILLITTQCNCQTSPIVITPKKFGLNSRHNVVIISDKNESIDVSLKEDTTGNVVLSKRYDVRKDEPLTAELDTRNVSLSATKVKLSVISGSNGKSESLIKLIPKSGFAFVQTDKPIYTPKETVLIRLLRLDDRLRPLHEKVKLRIKNSQKIILEETTINATEVNNFIDHKFEFPPAPKLGVWYAELWYGTNFSSNSTVSFEVKEYVLPTFSIKITSPKFILESSRNISGSVQVNYVYGKPVNGTAIFKFGTKAPNGRISYFGSTSLKQLQNGWAHYFVEIDQLRQVPLSWFPVVKNHRFVVEVSVNERATGRKDRTVDESGLFVTSPYMISYKNTFSDFKPNVETFITAQIFNVLGEVVTDLRVRLSLRDQSGQVIRHNSYANMSSNWKLESDHLGRISFPVTLDESVSQLHVLIKTDDPNVSPSEQTEAEHILYADQSTEGFVHISSKSKYSISVAVGDTYRSPVVVRGAIAPDRIYSVLTNRGHIIQSERIFTDRGIKIVVTNQMSPSIRIFVLGVTRSGKLVSDSVKIEVNQQNCGFDMSIANNTDEVLPGEVVNLQLNGSRGDYVALLGVDEAVYVLRNEDRLTKTKLMREVSKSDLGCGPGAGSDFNLVANNAGLKVITGETKLNEDSTDEHCIRRQSSKRVKRDLTPLTSLLNIYTGFLNKCCLLGTWPSNIRRNCEHKAAILKAYMPDHQQCYEAFLKCCKANIVPQVLQSTAFKNKTPLTSTDDRHRIGSGTEPEYVHVAYEQEMEDKAFIRKDFRETWLFDVVLLNKSSDLYPVTVPHSITTWSLTGMSLSSSNGLCILPSPLRLRTFRSIFLQISLPYSVVQNEQMEMVVTVFNYGSVRLPVMVYTLGIEEICSEATSVGHKIRKSLTVESNSFLTVAFPMVPLKTGEFELKVVALWSTGSDIVIKKLNVVPPGVTVEDAIPFQLDPKNRQRRSKRSIKTSKIEDEINSENSIQKTIINIEPDSTRNIVPGTRECIIAGIGDEYGATSYTTLNDIDRLIRQPKGCGEQTMLYMAPTLYTLKYLQSIQRLNGDLKYRGVKYLKHGYKRELSFRKDDGSFSGFPTRPSSVWLTAFVMKVLCQASPFLDKDQFDPKVINGAMKWLMDEQKRDGSWTEKYAVIHENALGGVKGTVPLTAYILISVHECSKIMTDEFRNDRTFESNVKKLMTKSESYLLLNQNEIIKQKNTYAMALVAYSLTFTDNDNASKLVEGLHATANVDNNRNFKYWRHEYDVETTGYALMALLNAANPKSSLDGISISNWLNSVRSFSGSFASTQDTIVALEALAQYIEKQRSPTNSISLLCNISAHNLSPEQLGSRFRRAMAFNRDNAQILQIFKMESDTPQLKVTTTGEGVGQMMIMLRYNVFEPPEVLCRFDLTIEVSEWKPPAEPRDIGPEIDDSFFNDFSPQLVQTLDLKKEPKLSRTKRFLGIRNLRNPFSRRKTQTDVEPKRSESFAESEKYEDIRSAITDDLIFKKNNLSTNSIASSEGKSRLVLVVETCIRHIPRYYTDMSLIEVGVLSGYKVNKDDLDEILRVEDSLVSKYEISDRNVVFYFEKVPFGKPYCIQFRTIQEHVVANIQSAMVKVYDYYHKDHTCTQVYTPSRLSEYIETKCNSQVCECAKRQNCPTSKSLVEIGNIAEKRILRARELFEELVCDYKYNYVFAANFENLNTTQNRYKFFDLKVNSVLKGHLKANDRFGLSLNPECDDSSLNQGRDAIIFGQFNERVGHLNGSSIVFDITQDLKADETRTSILKLIRFLENKIKREDWKCRS